MFSSRVEHRQQVEELEDEADVLAAQPRQLAVVERADLGAGDRDRARSRLVQAGEQCASASTCPSPTAPSRRRARPSARRARRRAGRRPRSRPRRSDASARGPPPGCRVAPSQLSLRCSPFVPSYPICPAYRMPDTACSIVRPMHETTPQVFLIARPSIDLEGMRGYLQDVGGESWLELRQGERGAVRTAASCSSSSAGAPATAAGSPA